MGGPWPADAGESGVRAQPDQEVDALRRRKRAGRARGEFGPAPLVEALRGQRKQGVAQFLGAIGVGRVRINLRDPAIGVRKRSRWIGQRRDGREEPGEFPGVALCSLSRSSTYEPVFSA